MLRTALRAVTEHGCSVRHEVLRVMSRLTIRARLVILSGVLLCMLIATNLYLMRTLANNSTAVATETELSSIIEFGERRAHCVR